MLKLDIDSEMLYQYFAFGHLPNTNKTIYKNITTLRPNGIFIIDTGCKIYEGPNKLFFSGHNKLYKLYLTNHFLDSIKYRYIYVNFTF